jgi:hypothetical protein
LERRQSANPSAPSTRHAIFLKVAFIREYSCCAMVKGRGVALPNKEVKNISSPHDCLSDSHPDAFQHEPRR